MAYGMGYFSFTHGSWEDAVWYCTILRKRQFFWLLNMPLQSRPEVPKEAFSSGSPGKVLTILRGHTKGQALCGNTSRLPPAESGFPLVWDPQTMLRCSLLPVTVFPPHPSALNPTLSLEILRQWCLSFGFHSCFNRECFLRYKSRSFLEIKK